MRAEDTNSFGVFEKSAAAGRQWAVRRGAANELSCAVLEDASNMLLVVYSGAGSRRNCRLPRPKLRELLDNPSEPRGYIVLLAQKARLIRTQ